MKALIFCPYYPPHIGGLESHADEFNKFISQQGISVTVFTTQLPRGSEQKEIRHKDVSIIRFPTFEIIPNYPLPKIWKSLFWILLIDIYHQRFDLVISRTRFFSTSLMALLY